MLAEVANVQTVYAKKEGGKSEKIQKTQKKYQRKRLQKHRVECLFARHVVTSVKARSESNL